MKWFLSLEIPSDAWLYCTQHSTVGEFAAHALRITTGLAVTFLPNLYTHKKEREAEFCIKNTCCPLKEIFMRSSEQNCYEKGLYTETRQSEVTGCGLSCWDLFTTRPSLAQWLVQARIIWVPAALFLWKKRPAWKVASILYNSELQTQRKTLHPRTYCSGTVSIFIG